MSNDNCGSIKCALCKKEAHVRRYKTASRKLYWWCDGCGIVRPSLPGGQTYIMAHAVIFGAEGPPKAAPVAPAPEVSLRVEQEKPKAPATPAPKADAPAPAPAKKRGFLGDWS